jgi:hypothetical protein
MLPDNPRAEGFLRTDGEKEATTIYARMFEASPDDVALKLGHVVKYMRRQDLTRLLARYEIFKHVLAVKGSIIECGVYRGSGLFSWANFSAILEPTNLTRRIYGFDSFEGFPEIGPQDRSEFRSAQKGELRSDCYDELLQLVHAYDLNRPLGHVGKVQLVKGDATQTIPAFVESNPHLIVSLLFLDFDLYEPTKAALEHFVSRMPRGAVIAFDELDNPAWPGETKALLDQLGIHGLRLRRVDFDPYIAFAILD